MSSPLHINQRDRKTHQTKDTADQWQIFCWLFHPFVCPADNGYSWVGQVLSVSSPKFFLGGAKERGPWSGSADKEVSAAKEEYYVDRRGSQTPGGINSSC